MSFYSEAAYFDGNHCAHVVAWEEATKAERLRQRAAQHRTARKAPRFSPATLAAGQHLSPVHAMRAAIVARYV